VEIHARSVFLQGLLLLNFDNRPDKFNSWDDLWKNWHGWLKKEKLSPLQTALGFVLSNKTIHRVIVGVDSIKQLKEILSAAKKIPARFPENLAITDENLLNPSLWGRL
jgi:aryl-alcohol dehydrogenase-like predicted oxidoreductase